MESNGNISRSCSSEPPLTRCRTIYATKVSILTYVLGENEFSWTREESMEMQFLVAFFLHRTLSKYVTLSIDNIVSLNEQQFVDSVPQRADELGPKSHESLPHFFPELPFLFRTESEDSAVMMSQLHLFFEFRRICHSAPDSELRDDIMEAVNSQVTSIWPRIEKNMFHGCTWNPSSNGWRFQRVEFHRWHVQVAQDYRG